MLTKGTLSGIPSLLLLLSLAVLLPHGPSSPTVIQAAGSAVDNPASDTARLHLALKALSLANRIAASELARFARHRRARNRHRLHDRNRRRGVLNDVAAACALEAVGHSDSCRAVAQRHGLRMDVDAAALCDGHRLCRDCATAGIIDVDGEAPDTCDRAFVSAATQLCLREADPLVCGRQADGLLAAVKETEGAVDAGRGGRCSRGCARQLFARLL